MAKVVIKKTFAKNTGFPGGVVWFHADLPDSHVWLFDRHGATSMDREAAEKLLVELKRNRPDDAYEIVALE